MYFVLPSAANSIKLGVRDVMLFMKLYVEGLSLKKISLQVGVNYSTTAVNWASMVREVMVDKGYRTLPNLKFTDVEIDESLFGRKVKHHRGAPKGILTLSQTSPGFYVSAVPVF